MKHSKPVQVSVKRIRYCSIAFSKVRLVGLHTERTFKICAAQGRPAWPANVDSACYNRVMDCPEDVPSLEGSDPWVCYGCLGGPFTPALSPRAGQELGATGHYNLPPCSGIAAKSLPDGSWASAELWQRQIQCASRQLPQF